MKSILLKITVMCAVAIFAFTPTAVSASGGAGGSGAAGGSGGAGYTWKKGHVWCYDFNGNYFRHETCDGANGTCHDQYCFC